MEKSNKRGKIPQTDWPSILARYEAGETLSSIARTYDCSPPAISYIVSRNREKAAIEASPPPAAEAQLVKAVANGAVNHALPHGEPPPVARIAQTAPAPVAELRRETVTDARSAGPMGGEQRRSLALSLGNGNGNRMPAEGDGHRAESTWPTDFGTSRQSPQGAGERMPRPFQAPLPTRNGHSLPAAPDGRPTAQQPREDVVRKDNGAFIDQELRTRVDGDIAAFLAAFDAALAADTQESRFALREATDRLLRAGARTRIELERLEARLPLPAHASDAESHRGSWRYR